MTRCTSTVDKAKAYYDVYIGLKKELIDNKIDFREDVLMFWASNSPAPRLFLSEKHVAGIISNITKQKKEPKSREGRKLYAYIKSELLQREPKRGERAVDIAREIIEKPAPSFFLSVSRCRELIVIALKG